jgi:hypothetical protein
MEDLPTVEYGDEPRLQAQMTPLSAAAAIPAMPASPAAPTAAAVRHHQAEVKREVEATQAAMQVRVRRDFDTMTKPSLSVRSANGADAHSETFIEPTGANGARRPTQA